MAAGDNKNKPPHHAKNARAGGPGGDEMPVTLPVGADETFRHGLILHSHPLRLTESRGKSAREIQSQRMGHPISVEGG